MKSVAEIEEIIINSTGTTAYHSISPIEGFPVLTDGCKAVAEAAECYWFFDIVGNYQIDTRLDPYFQVWTLMVDLEENTAVINGFNDRELIITQEIPFTDFPMKKFTVWVESNVILLPSEH